MKSQNHSFNYCPLCSEIPHVQKRVPKLTTCCLWNFSRKRETTAVGILAIAFFPFLQTFLIIQRLKDSAEIASVLSQLEIEGIPGKELCSFCTLQCARKENWENIFWFALFFSPFSAINSCILWWFFFLLFCFLVWFGFFSSQGDLQRLLCKNNEFSDMHSFCHEGKWVQFLGLQVYSPSPPERHISS